MTAHVDRDKIAAVWSGIVPLTSRLVSVARKAGHCDNGICAGRIEVGDEYVNGESNVNAGGFGRDRYCADCLGGEPKVRRGRLT